ncbi:MAG: thermonuclease family protein [bacterium]|jgi:micrococcal nuclease
MRKLGIAVAIGLVATIALTTFALAGRTVYITKTGAKYHLGSCRYLKKSKIAIDIDDAVARGYSPCSVCNPGSPDSSSKPKDNAPEEPATDDTPDLVPIELSRVVDGDTIEVEFMGAVDKVRYIGIDTPEMHYPDGPPDPWAVEATKFNEKLLEGRKLTIEFDVDRRDKYGRILGYVWAEDKDGKFMVNAQLVRYGYAVLLTIPPNVKYVDRFKAAQEKAKEEKLNLWSD